MKKKMTIVLCLVAVMFSFLPFPMDRAEASERDQSVNLTIEDNELLYDNLNPSDESVQPKAISKIVIYFLDVVVGYVVDGVITYVSGKAPSDWVAFGITKTENKIRSLSKNTIQIIISRDGTVSGCMKFPCPIRT